MLKAIIFCICSLVATCASGEVAKIEHPRRLLHDFMSSQKGYKVVVHNDNQYHLCDDKGYVHLIAVWSQPKPDTFIVTIDSYYPKLDSIADSMALEIDRKGYYITVYYNKALNQK